MTPELDDLDSLLQAAESLLSKHHSKKEVNPEHYEPQVYMLESKGSYTCLQCNRVYHGVIKHLNKEPTNKRVGSCPKCIDEASWWRRKGFVVEYIEELHDKQKLSTDSQTV